MLWKILPQTVFHAAGAGQKKPAVAEEGAVLQRTVLFISQRERLYTLTGFLPPSTPGAFLSAWILHDQCGVTPAPCTPLWLWGIGMGGGDFTGGNEL